MKEERPFDKLTEEEKAIIREKFYFGLIDAPTDKSTREDMGLKKSKRGCK